MWNIVLRRKDHRRGNLADSIDDWQLSDIHECTTSQQIDYSHNWHEIRLKNRREEDTAGISYGK